MTKRDERITKAVYAMSAKLRRPVAVTEHGGHLIYSTLGTYEKEKPSPWRYIDTDELLDNNHPRPCVVCNKERVHNQPDPCFGWLPGVKFACCGHGFRGQGYITFDDDTEVRW